MELLYSETDIRITFYTLTKLFKPFDDFQHPWPEGMTPHLRYAYNTLAECVMIGIHHKDLYNISITEDIYPYLHNYINTKITSRITNIPISYFPYAKYCGPDNLWDNKFFATFKTVKMNVKRFVIKVAAYIRNNYNELDAASADYNYKFDISKTDCIISHGIIDLILAALGIMKPVDGMYYLVKVIDWYLNGKSWGSIEYLKSGNYRYYEDVNMFLCSRTDDCMSLSQKDVTGKIKYVIEKGHNLRYTLPDVNNVWNIIFPGIHEPPRQDLFIQRITIHIDTYRKELTDALNGRPIPRNSPYLG